VKGKGGVVSATWGDHRHIGNIVSSESFGGTAGILEVGGGNASQKPPYASFTEYAVLPLSPAGNGPETDPAAA